MRFLFIYLILFLPVEALGEPACEEPQPWTPEIKFKLEDSSFRETMHWISGWSYSLGEQIKEQKAGGFPAQICSCSNTVSSKFILDVLNKEFSGQTFTADQASNFIWQAIKKHFRCASGK